MRKSVLALALVAILPTFAFAAEEAKKEEPKSPHTLTGNLTLASEYIYRGIGQTNRKPALQGGFDYAHESGVYLGTWGSNISWLSDANSAVSASLEVDVYGGYKGSAGDFSYDVGVLQYYYPGSYPTGYNLPNTTEVYVGGGYKTVTLKYSHALTDLFGTLTPSGGDTKGSGYLDLTGTYEISGVTLTAHAGYQKVKDYKDASYADWKIGASKELAGLTFGVAYIDTNAKGKPGQFYYSTKGKDLGKGRALITVGKTF